MHPASISTSVLLVLLATMAVSLDLSRAKQQQIEVEFQSRSESTTTALREHFGLYRDAVHSVASLFQASQSVEREEFQVFVSRALSRYPGLKSMQWVPRVPQSRRAEFEQNARDDGLADFRFKQWNSSSDQSDKTEGKWITNDDHWAEEYFPVMYDESAEKGVNAFGDDLASRPTYSNTLDEARDTGQLVITPPVHPSGDMEMESLVLFVVPTFASKVEPERIEERREKLLGFAVGVLDIAEVTDAIVRDGRHYGIAVSVIDESNGKGGVPLFEYNRPNSKTRLPSSLNEKHIYHIGRRIWGFHYQALPVFVSARTSWHSWLILPAGIIISILLGIVIHKATMRTQLVEEIVEKRTAELENERYLLNTLVETIPDPVFFKDREGKFVRVNKAMATDAGFDTPADIIGKTDFDIWAGELPEETIRDEQKILETGEPIINKVEKPIKKDGPQRWVLVSKLPFRNLNGEIIGTFGVAREFTERKQMEDELQALNDELNNANQALESINHELAMRVRESEQARERAEAAEKRLQLSVESLAESADRYHKLIDNIPICATRKSKTGEVTFVNRAFCEFVDVKPDDILGKTDFDLFPEELARKYQADDQRVMETGTIHEFREKNIKDGQPRDVNVIKVPWFDDQGNTEGVLVAFWDITEQVAYEDQLRDFAVKLQIKSNELLKVNNALQQSNLDLQQFAYVASHDLQTPLRGIAGFAEFLAQDYHGKLDDQADDYINRIVNGCKRMQQLIQDLLSYSRVESRAAPLEPVNLNEVLDDLLALMRIKINENDARVTRDELPTIHADRSQITQLYQNLIENSLKYRGEDSPVIHLSARHEKKSWVLSVQDNGIGIDPEHQDRVFEIFRRLHSDKTYPGTGIGLAICRRIVGRHDGEIWITSNEGQGCTFHFSIPDFEPSDEQDNNESARDVESEPVTTEVKKPT